MSWSVADRPATVATCHGRSPPTAGCCEARHRRASRLLRPGRAGCRSRWSGSASCCSSRPSPDSYGDRRYRVRGVHGRQRGASPILPGPAARPARTGPGAGRRERRSSRLAIALLVVSVQADWPDRRRRTSCAARGRRLAPPGRLVRARPLVPRAGPARRDVQTAFALESGRSTRPSSSSARSWSRCWPRPSHPVARARRRRGRLRGRHASAFSAPARDGAAPRTPARRTRSGPRPRMPWRTVVPARRREPRPGRAVRRRRGHHRRLRRRAATPRPLAGAAARPLGARQPGGRRRHRRRELAPRAVLPGPLVGALAMAAAMVPLFFVDSLPLMGALALRRPASRSRRR